MDIHAMKRAAKKASRQNGTSHGSELNAQAHAAGFTHWGALIAAQPKPSFHYRYFPGDHENAHDLESARRDGNHIVYVAEDIEHAIAHVVAMANTCAKLPPKDIAKAQEVIAAPDPIFVLDEGASRDWSSIPPIQANDFMRAPAGAAIFIEKITEEHVTSAPKGVMLIGAGKVGGAASWNEKSLQRFRTLIIPKQDFSQITKPYSKRDKDIIDMTISLEKHLSHGHS